MNNNSQLTINKPLPSLQEKGLDAIWIYSFDTAINTNSFGVIDYCDFLIAAFDSIPKRAREHIGRELKDYLRIKQKEPILLLDSKINRVLRRKWEKILELIESTLPKYC
jgi:hypothetical protein